MTQVIAVTTQRSVFLVADRRLTYGPGPRKGELVDDDTCKLVSLGGVCAIGYTGLADLGAQPTHEWVATLLAAANCDRGSAAARILTEKSTELFSRLPGPFSHSFVMVGWARFNGLPRPYIIEITNCRGADGSLLETPVHEFVALVSPLEPDAPPNVRVVGQPLRTAARDPVLRRMLRRLEERGVSDRTILKLLVDEIVCTARSCSSVGQKVLATVVPRRAVAERVAGGYSRLAANEPTETEASFSYFEPGYSGVVQYGPTFVANGWAFSKVEAMTDGARQALEVKVLHQPSVVDPSKSVGLILRGNGRNGYLFDLVSRKLFRLDDGVRVELTGDGDHRRDHR